MPRRFRYVLVVLIALLSACGTQQTASPTTAPATTAAPVATAPSQPTSAPAATTAAEATVVPVATDAPTAIPNETELTVFAAASLTGAFKDIATSFAAEHGNPTVTFNFAGSDQLAQQITQGAPADVFASANKKQMEVTIQAGDVISGTERTFVRNRLVVVYPSDNPGHLQALTDLAKPGLKIVLANKSVPVGGYSLDYLAKASKLPDYTAAYSETVLNNVVSYEENVKAVLSKVSLGEADAGIVYTTDAATITDGSIGTLAIPDNLNTIATYPIAPTKNAKSPALAKQFVEYVLSAAGQQILVKYGFIPTNGSATGAAPTAVPLEIGGMVDAPTTLSLEDFKKLEYIDVKATDKGGTEQTYQGVAIAKLLEQAGLKSGATKLVLIGGDGYTAELPLSDLQADPNAIVSVDENGAFRDIIPSQKPKVWVKGLVKIDVQ